MTSLFKRIECFANVAIIITGLLLSSVLVKNYLLSTSILDPKPTRTKDQVQQDRVQRGAQISVPGIDWTKSNQTLLLAISSTCHYCTESAPFYQRLVKESAEKNVRLIAVLPQPVNIGKDYLKGLGIDISEVIEASFDLIGINGTPTLILVDNKGVVLDSWLGKLPDAEEAKVLSRVRENITQK